MTPTKLIVPLLLLLILALNVLSNERPARDGHLYDQGRAMTELSPRAPKVLDKMNAILGHWDVAVTTYLTDSTSHSATGTADITYMNRGHAYMSRIHIPGYDEAGNEASIMQFLNYNPTNETWVLGEANSYTESISMYNGNFKEKKLVLSTAVRERGGPLLTWYRVHYSNLTKDAFDFSIQRSMDNGDTWKVLSEHIYTRRSTSEDFMRTDSQYGTPSPARPEESNQFDFLLGEWTASNNIFYNNQWIKYPANATAVYALNGHAILEHSWYDLDPNVPDAATTILRMYNRSMRRWESLYLDNRGHNQLFFGGQQEGDSLVLQHFESSTNAPFIPQYIFHDIEADSYGWYGQNSRDRGQSFERFWEITFERKSTQQ